MKFVCVCVCVFPLTLSVVPFMTCGIYVTFPRAQSFQPASAFDLAKNANFDLQDFIDAYNKVRIAIAFYLPHQLSLCIKNALAHAPLGLTPHGHESKHMHMWLSFSSPSRSW